MEDKNKTKTQLVKELEELRKRNAELEAFEIKYKKEEKEKLFPRQIIQTEKRASPGEIITDVVHDINNPNCIINYNIPLLEETWQMFEPILKEYAADHPEWRRNNTVFEELILDMKEIIYAIRIGSERINKVVSNLKGFAHFDKTS